MSDNRVSALVMIDWQDGFDDWDYWGGNRNNPQAEENARQLLDHWRSNQWPIVYVSHHSLNRKSPLRMDGPGGKIKELLAPRKGEVQMTKRMNSGFIGTDLDGYLRRAGMNDLVISGLTTNHCVSTTTRMAGNMGFNVRLVGEACATFDRTAPDGTVFPSEQVHQMELASLNHEFCDVVDLKTVLTGKIQEAAA